MKKTKKPLLKWSQTVPLKHPDTIKSSIFSERGEQGFIPTYDQGRPNLCYLLSNEYMRMWFKERDQYAKDTYTKQDIKAEGNVNRRFVQRYIRHVEREKIMPIPKRLQNVTASDMKKGMKSKNCILAPAQYVVLAEEAKLKQFIRYKPDCKNLQ